MKNLLSILGTISLITSVSSNLIACNNNQLTSEKLVELKEENSKIIKGNKLEWIAPQEKPFDAVDNKWYVVIWRGNENDNWKITKFNHDKFKTIDNYDKYELVTSHFRGDLLIGVNAFIGYDWKNDNGTYFKSVYRWKGNNEPSIIKINNNGEITN